MFSPYHVFCYHILQGSGLKASGQLGNFCEGSRMMDSNTKFKNINSILYCEYFVKFMTFIKDSFHLAGQSIGLQK